MNYLDLFHGIGGFALGAYCAGMKFEHHYCSDIEPYAQKLYSQRFPDSVQLGDITKIKTEDLPHGEWIISGGFPCQDISIAGKGTGITGSRSGLWFEYWRIIRDIRPRFAIMENVGALTFRGLDQVLGSLSEIGYNAEWQDIRASDVGAPHKRERIWIVAYPDTTSHRWQRERTIPAIKEGREQGLEYAGKLESRFERLRQDVANTGRKYGKQRNTTRVETSQGQRAHSELYDQPSCQGRPNIPHTTSERLERQESEGKSRQYDRLLAKCYARNWSTEPAMGRLVNGLPGRVDRLKGLGNAIVPQIAEILFRRINESDTGQTIRV